jgi:hypothetical protein
MVDALIDFEHIAPQNGAIKGLPAILAHDDAGSEWVSSLYRGATLMFAAPRPLVLLIAHIQGDYRATTI